jgi:hypothetical protein
MSIKDEEQVNEIQELEDDYTQTFADYKEKYKDEKTLRKERFQQLWKNNKPRVKKGLKNVFTLGGLFKNPKVDLPWQMPTQQQPPARRERMDLTVNVNPNRGKANYWVFIIIGGCCLIWFVAWFITFMVYASSQGWWADKTVNSTDPLNF